MHFQMAAMYTITVKGTIKCNVHVTNHFQMAAMYTVKGTIKCNIHVTNHGIAHILLLLFIQATGNTNLQSRGYHKEVQEFTGIAGLQESYCRNQLKCRI